MTKRKITSRQKIKVLLKLARITAGDLDDPSEMDAKIKEYEELLEKSDDEIDEYIKQEVHK